MAESLERQDYRRNSNHSQRPQQTYYRGSRGRGRGGHGGQVQYTLNRLGVTDLRQHLNRNRDDKEEVWEEEGNVPPPDPAYNYLKDPSREMNNSGDSNRNQHFRSGHPHRQSFNRQQHNDSKPSETNADSNRDFQNRGRSFSRGRGQFRGRGKPQNQPVTYIENPCNIKVEVKSTGDRSYTLDETTKLPNIKHMPDNSPESHKNFQHNNNVSRSRGRGSFRGRNRGNPRNYNTRNIRKNKNENNNNNKDSGENLQIECKNEAFTKPSNTNNTSESSVSNTDIDNSNFIKNNDNQQEEYEYEEEYGDAHDHNKEYLKDYEEIKIDNTGIEKSNEVAQNVSSNAKTNAKELNKKSDNNEEHLENK